VPDGGAALKAGCAGVPRLGPGAGGKGVREGLGGGCAGIPRLGPGAGRQRSARGAGRRGEGVPDGGAALKAGCAGVPRLGPGAGGKGVREGLGGGCAGIPRLGTPVALCMRDLRPPPIPRRHLYSLPAWQGTTLCHVCINMLDMGRQPCKNITQKQCTTSQAVPVLPPPTTPSLLHAQVLSHELCLPDAMRHASANC
jgi:hypothetical protein